jgi:hypothetical protein
MGSMTEDRGPLDLTQKIETQAIQINELKEINSYHRKYVGDLLKELDQYKAQVLKLEKELRR